MSSGSGTNRAGTGWKEVYLRGSKEAEDALHRQKFAAEINQVQRDVRWIEGQRSIERAQQNKMRAGTKNAAFEILPDIPEDLRVSLFQPGKKYKAHVRFSNASSMMQPDAVPDLRGVAFRVMTGAGANHDLLLTNAPYSHARDARQFMIIATAITRVGHPAFLWRVGAWRTIAGLVRIARRLGLKETRRVVSTIRQQTAHPVASLATERYWSRAAFAFGAVAVKFRLEPTVRPGDEAAPDLRAELVSRLKSGAITFDFQMQRYVDPESTPIEDGTVEWKGEAAPFFTVARLVIPAQELDPADEADIDRYAFNPWYTASDEIRPLGSLNRSRKAVYEASARLRGGEVIS